MLEGAGVAEGVAEGELTEGEGVGVAAGVDGEGSGVSDEAGADEGEGEGTEEGATAGLDEGTMERDNVLAVALLDIMDQSTPKVRHEQKKRTGGRIRVPLGKVSQR